MCTWMEVKWSYFTVHVVEQTVVGQGPDFTVHCSYQTHCWFFTQQKISKFLLVTMDSPDELYTLRTQFYLGHYNLCLEEAKALSRHPLSAEAKIEREEFQLRAMSLLRMYDKVAVAARSSGSPGTLNIFESLSF